MQQNGRSKQGGPQRLNEMRSELSSTQHCVLCLFVLQSGHVAIVIVSFKMTPRTTYGIVTLLALFVTSTKIKHKQL